MGCRDRIAIQEKIARSDMSDDGTVWEKKRDCLKVYEILE